MSNDEGGLLPDLLQIQKTLHSGILNTFTDEEKEFLISFKKGTPDWQLIGLPNLKRLPGVKWKLMNISKMEKHKHKDSIRKLEHVLL